MGTNEDIMHEFVRRELKRLFPAVDGWQVKSLPRTPEGAAFVVSRRILGRTEGAHVLVTFGRKVTGESARTLREIAAGSPIGGVPTPRLVVMAPQGADAADLPGDVELIPMRSFGYEGETLVWLRRRSRERARVPAA
ncbi:MAG: hypothetical protein QFX32_07755 [Methanolinea sp.]|nr:hypothetical protein [Methanolinea sp.]